MKKITEYLEQSENNLICNKECTLSIDLNDYTVGDSIKIESSSIWVKSLVSIIEFDDLTFNLILDYPVEMTIQKMEKIEKQFIKLIYTKNSIILEVPLEQQELKEQIGYVERLLGGKEIYKDVNHLLGKLFKVYGGKLSDMDLVHMETLLSHCLRDKADIHQPARLGKTWDPVMVNIKKIIFSEGFVQGLSFENIGEAIKTGLITDKEVEPSILERIVTGQLVKEKRVD